MEILQNQSIRRHQHFTTVPRLPKVTVTEPSCGQLLQSIGLIKPGIRRKLTESLLVRCVWERGRESANNWFEELHNVNAIFGILIFVRKFVLPYQSLLLNEFLWFSIRFCWKLVCIHLEHWLLIFMTRSPKRTSSSWALDPGTTLFTHCFESKSSATTIHTSVPSSVNLSLTLNPFSWSAANLQCDIWLRGGWSHYSTL